MDRTRIKEILLEVGVPVRHFKAEKLNPPYIVWAEDGQGGMLYANDRALFQSITGSIDYFTRDEYDPNFAKIQKLLTEAEISWRLNSIQLNEETGVKHYEWVWEVDEWH